MPSNATQTLRRITALLGFSFVLLTFSASAEEPCRLNTFKGAYGLTVTGYVLPASTAGSFGTFTPTFTITTELAIPLQGIQLLTSDGNGNLTDKESLSLGGNLLAVSDPSKGLFSVHTGTYTVNPDCTGVAFLTNLGQPGITNANVNFISLAFIINKAGTKIRMVGVPTCPPTEMVTACTYDSGGIERTVTSVGDRLEEPESPFSRF